MEQGHFEKAIADFTETIRFDPENADAYAARGLLREIIGETAKAAADRAKAKELGYKPDPPG